MNFDDDEEVVLDEVIENIEWVDLLKSLNNLNLKEHLQRKRKQLDSNFIERVNKSLIELNKFLLDNKCTCNINSGMSRLQEQRAKKNLEEDQIMKRFKQCLLALQRDIDEFAHNQKYTKDNMLITICLLRIIEECVLVFEDTDILDITLKLLCILTFFDCSLQLLINSVSLQIFLFGMLEIYYYSNQQIYPGIKEKLVILLCQLLCYYQFVNQQHQDIDLVSQLIRVYEYYNKQQYEYKVYQIEHDLIEATEEEYKEINRLDLYQMKMANTQLFKINKLKENKVLKDLSGTYFTMTLEISYLVTGTMATFSNQICCIPFDTKMDLYMTCSRYLDNIFLIMVSIKILQSLALDSKFREDNSTSNQNYVKLIQMTSQNTDYFCISRESIRVYNNLLFGFDDLLLWLKFDTLNITNENSNYLKIRYSEQVIMMQYGNPKKLLKENSIYYDQCGVDFKPQSGIEIVGYTQDFSKYRTPKKGLQLPNQITISFWFQYLEKRAKRQLTNFNFHTLLCCSDGETPLICTDPQFMFLGVASVGNQDITRALDVALLTPGIKFFVTQLGKTLFTGWNNIIITIDNTKCESQLYINGKFKEVLEGVFSPLNITYIGNNKSGNESFGAVADIRVYSKLLNLSEVKLLSFYDKNIKILTRKNIIDELQTIKLIQDLKKFIQDSQYMNTELCAAALECVSLMCFMSIQIRLETAKNGIFDQALLLLNCNQDLIKQSASQVILSIR